MLLCCNATRAHTQPMEEAIMAIADDLGVNVETEPYLLWIVEEVRLSNILHSTSKRDQRAVIIAH